MLARAQYEQELREMDNEEEEDLEIIDGAVESDATGEVGSFDKGKGKQRAIEDIQTETRPAVSQKRKRPATDPFAGKC